MSDGRVKWFDNSKGFGFIEQVDGEDLFVHYSAILEEDFKVFKLLMEGDFVSFDVVQGHKGPFAQNVRKL